GGRGCRREGPEDAARQRDHVGGPGNDRPGGRCQRRRKENGRSSDPPIACGRWREARRDNRDRTDRARGERAQGRRNTEGDQRACERPRLARARLVLVDNSVDGAARPSVPFRRASSSAVEQETLNLLVVGSNPSWLTRSR